MRRALPVLLLWLALPATAFANAAPRIVGGAKSSIDKYPFQVALLSTDTSAFSLANEYQHQFCGGSILDETHVITAAHCVYDSVVPGQAAPPASIQVLASTDKLADPDGTPKVNPGPDEQRLAVIATSFDPSYDPNLTDHDAAVLTLAAPIDTVLRPAKPISILGGADVSAADAGQPVDVSGWGGLVAEDPDFTFPQVYPHDLYAVTTHVVDVDTCNDAYDGSITQRMICAGEELGGKDSCQGDSGGPLAADLDATNATDFRLVGIVSTGSGCGFPGFPGIYTRAFEPSIQSFLTSNPPQAPVQTSGATLTGAPEPGQTLTCSPGSWLGNPTFTYSFGGAFGNAATYVVTSQDVGRTIRCTVRARNAGGFGEASSAGLVAHEPAAPPPPPPPPPPSQDTTPPTSTVKFARCRGTRCVLNVAVTDPPYTAGLGKLSVKARSVERIRCRRRADRRRGRVCTRTRNRSAKVSRLGGTVFTAVLRKVKPGRHTFTILATDAAGNRQAKPLRVKLTLKAKKRRR